MNPARNILSAILLGGILSALGIDAAGQDTTNSPRSVPPIPVAKSPVDAFRELLAMDSTAMRAALSNRNEQARERLRKKISDYRALDPDERELRLVATELRWYLPQLMRLHASNRVERLNDIRSDLRPLIESRLERWDALPVKSRELFLQNEQAFSLLLQIGSASDREREKLVSEVSPESRATLNQALARLDAMSPTERERAFDVFENVFTMTAAEKERALRVMSAAEKAQMEKTLETFSKLTPEQRRRCIAAYEKFASMSVPTRALFYRNVQLWEKMSPKERQEWRDLVKIAEILPPVPVVKPPVPPSPPFPLTRLSTNKT